MDSTAALPTDVATLQALLLASEERLIERDAVIERKEDRIIRLENLVAGFKRALFGSKSEKADPDQYQLALEDIETASLESPGRKQGRTLWLNLRPR